MDKTQRLKRDLLQLQSAKTLAIVEYMDAGNPAGRSSIMRILLKELAILEKAEAIYDKGFKRPKP